MQWDRAGKRDYSKIKIWYHEQIVIYQKFKSLYRSSFLSSILVASNDPNFTSKLLAVKTWYKSLPFPINSLTLPHLASHADIGLLFIHTSEWDVTWESTLASGFSSTLAPDPSLLSDPFLLDILLWRVVSFVCFPWQTVTTRTTFPWRQQRM